VGVADRLVLHRTQPESVGGVVGRLLQAAIVERHHLRLPVLEKQLAVVGAGEAVTDDAGDTRFVEAGAVDEGCGHGGSGVVSFLAR
jgi:hypothetical protein